MKCKVVNIKKDEADIIGDIANIEDLSRSVLTSTCQGLDLPGQASRNKQSESLAEKQGVSIEEKGCTAHDPESSFTMSPRSTTLLLYFQNCGSNSAFLR